MNKTCKDCIRNDMCKKRHFPSMFGLTGDGCDDFKHKSRYIELPCAVGDDVWWISSEDGTIQCEKNGIKGVAYYGGNKFKVITDEAAPEEIGTRWCCLSQEEAENLAKRGNYDD